VEVLVVGSSGIEVVEGVTGIAVAVAAAENRAGHAAAAVQVLVASSSVAATLAIQNPAVTAHTHPAPDRSSEAKGVRPENL